MKTYILCYDYHQRGLHFTNTIYKLLKGQIYKISKKEFPKLETQFPKMETLSPKKETLCYIYLSIILSKNKQMKFNFT